MANLRVKGHHQRKQIRGITILLPLACQSRAWQTICRIRIVVLNMKLYKHNTQENSLYIAVSQ